MPDHSLRLSLAAAVLAAPCRPFDVARDGISIGEAAAFALLERVPGRLDGDAVLLLGVGESSDAYHMSAPHPEGLGARRAMQAALAAAALEPGDIDYINLHGTGTPSNDRSESQAVTSVFGPTTPCSSTKGATGHTLGAAGALEAVISALALQHGLMPGGVHTARDRSDAHGALHQGESPRPDRARAQQFLRLRRHELQPDFRPRRMTLVGLRRRHRRPRPRPRQLAATPRPCCRADSAYRAAPTVLPMPTLLPPAERRRTGRVVKLALARGVRSRRRSAGVDPAESGQRVLLLRRRRPQLPRNLPGAGARRPRDLADAFLQFRAQRRRRILEHRHGRHGRIERAVRLRRELLRRSAWKP